MRRFLYHRGSSGSGQLNMTPMIDVTFLLVTFFTLTTHFASAEKTKIDLPRPDDNQAVEQRFREKVIINVLYTGEDTEPALQLGALAVGSMEELADRLGEVARENPRVQVILRADRRLEFGHVRQVMGIAAALGLPNLQIVTDLSVER